MSAEIPGLEEFAKFPKLNSLVIANPIFLNPQVDEENETKKAKITTTLKNEQIFRLKENMENPENQLELDANLYIQGTTKERILDMKKRICESLVKEEDTINEELAGLKHIGMKKDDILKTKNQDVNIGSVSYTSLLIYLNHSGKGEGEQSMKMKPGHAIAKYINDQFDAAEGEGWRSFVRIVLKALSAHTFFMTRLVEYCQFRQVKKSDRNLELLAQIAYQGVKKGQLRTMNSVAQQNEFELHPNDKNLFASCIMTKAKHDELKELITTYKSAGNREFVMPGILPVERNQTKALEKFKTLPFDGEGEYLRVLFKIEIDKEGVEDAHKDGNGKIQSNALNLNENLCIVPTGDNERHMLMAMPVLKFVKDGLKDQFMAVAKNPKKENAFTKYAPASVFVVSQKSYESQYKLTTFDARDIEILCFIAKGAFGDVFLGKRNGEYLAVKMISKTKLLMKKAIEVDQVIFEIDTQYAHSHHQNLLEIHEVIENENEILLILPFEQGGDLQNFIKVSSQNFNTNMKEEQIKFFAVQIIQAIGYFHSQNIIHRDVKMGNVLIDMNGYLKLCDFGMAKHLLPGETTCENVGSRITWAPEVIKKEPYREMTDWWSVGIIIFQCMMKGKTPFYMDKGEMTDDEFKEVSDKAVTDKDLSTEKIFFGDGKIGAWQQFSPELRDLVMKLVERDPTKRLGANGDVTEVLAHPVFNQEFIDKVNNKEFVADTLPSDKTVLDLTQDFSDIKFKQEISDRLFYPDRDLIEKNQASFEVFKKYEKGVQKKEEEKE